MASHNNGKASEAEVQKVLRQIADGNESFDWQRMYDATSARGAFMAQTGDFQFFTPDVHGVIEVKSTKHPSRLSKSAFSDNQLVKLQRRINAGGKVLVLVHHWQTGVWHYIAGSEVCQAFQNGAASLDLSTFKDCGSAAEALAEPLLEIL